MKVELECTNCKWIYDATRIESFRVYEVGENGQNIATSFCSYKCLNRWYYDYGAFSDEPYQ